MKRIPTLMYRIWNILQKLLVVKECKYDVPLCRANKWTIPFEGKRLRLLLFCKVYCSCWACALSNNAFSTAIVRQRPNPTLKGGASMWISRFQKTFLKSRFSWSNLSLRIVTKNTFWIMFIRNTRLLIYKLA